MIIEGRNKDYIISIISEVIYNKYLKAYRAESGERPEIKNVLDSLKGAANEAANNFVEKHKIRSINIDGVFIKWGKTSKDIWPSCKQIAVEKYCDVMDNSGYNLQLSTNRRKIKELKRL
jgi:hypothetical protein